MKLTGSVNGHGPKVDLKGPYEQEIGKMDNQMGSCGKLKGKDKASKCGAAASTPRNTYMYWPLRK